MLLVTTMRGLKGELAKSREEVEKLRAALAKAAQIADYYPNRFDMADNPPSLQYACDEIAGEIRALAKT